MKPQDGTGFEGYAWLGKEEIRLLVNILHALAPLMLCNERQGYGYSADH